MRHFTVEQIAEFMQIEPVTVRRRCANRSIPGATKAAGVWRIPEDGFREWLASGRPRQTPGVVKPTPSGTMRAGRRQFRALEGGRAA